MSERSKAELSSNPCQLNPPAPAKGEDHINPIDGRINVAPSKGVAVVEEYQSAGFGVIHRVRLGRKFYYTRDNEWGPGPGSFFASRDIAEAVAAAINAREAKSVAHWHNDLGGNRKIPVSNDSLANAIADFAYALGRAANELARRAGGAK